MNRAAEAGLHTVEVPAEALTELRNYYGKLLPTGGVKLITLVGTAGFEPRLLKPIHSSVWHAHPLIQPPILLMPPNPAWPRSTRCTRLDRCPRLPPPDRTHAHAESHCAPSSRCQHGSAVPPGPGARLCLPHHWYLAPGKLAERTAESLPGTA